MPTGRTKVTLTWAQSLDGQIATIAGSSRWISGNDSLVMTHQMRADSDAIMVGRGTVVKDDPKLTCRNVSGTNPHRFVLDSLLQTPLAANVVNTDQAPTTIFCTVEADANRRRSLEERGVTVTPVSKDGNGLDLGEVLRCLESQGIRSLMVEGGSEVITAFLRKRLAHELVITLAPLIIGTGTPAVGDLQTEDLAKALRGATREFSRHGNDLVWRIGLDNEKA